MRDIRRRKISGARERLSSMTALPIQSAAMPGLPDDGQADRCPARCARPARNDRTAFRMSGVS